MTTPVPGFQPHPGPSPAPPGDISSTVAWMLAQMEISKAEERKLRERELANQQSIFAILASQGSGFDSAGDSSSVNLVLDVLHPSRGRLGIVKRPNPAADREAGVTLPPQYGIVGDMATIDMSSARHKIKSGKDLTDNDEVLVQELWPNQFLQRMLCGRVRHQDLDPIKFASGFVTKVYCEMPPVSAGSREHNHS